jgi:hypothetical protein
VSYVGRDNFLMRMNPAGVQSGSIDGRISCTYGLEMWPNWKRALLPGTPAIASWFTERAANGWNLLGHYEGAIFLFAAPA